ncbi:MAG: AAA family ATPase [Acidimicrobiales bacterium]|nr:AAA family ATPase [Acidimicrobiales bacterium]
MTTWDERQYEREYAAWEPYDDVPPPGDNGDRYDDTAPATSWAAVDLTDALDGGDLPGPAVLARSDGTNLLYRGRVHWFMGESESCKSWAAMAGAAQVVAAGGRVLWVDFEDDERGVVARLYALGLTREQIAAHFVYVRPDEPLADRHGLPTGAAVDLAGHLAQPWDLVVIDGVTEAMVTEGLDLMSNADVARWMRALPRRFAEQGAAVVCIDHVTKSADTRGRYAIGGQHKLAGISGAAFRFDTVRPFARPVGSDPSTGTVTVHVTKDRPGHVRGAAVDGVAAVLDLTGWPDGAVTVAVDPPGEVTADMAVVAKVLDYLSAYDGSSKNAIEKGLGGNANAVRTALRWMVDRLWLTVEKVGQGHYHYLTDLGRAEL